MTMNFMALLLVSLLSLLLFSPSEATAAATAIPTATIQRVTKQQILAQIPPGSPQSVFPFLASPSGKYTAYFIRRATAPNAGGFGNDFCFMQIQETSGKSVWESECQPVSSANACSLVFSDQGLSVFDGSHMTWDTGASSRNSFPATLQLVDLGDMRVIDQDGELVWKATDDVRNNQHCGLLGAPGLAIESPPFVQPFSGGTKPPFGLEQPLSSATTPETINGDTQLVTPPASSTVSLPPLPADNQSSSGDAATEPPAPLATPLPDDQSSSGGDITETPAPLPSSPLPADQSSNGGAITEPLAPVVTSPLPSAHGSNVGNITEPLSPSGTPLPSAQVGSEGIPAASPLLSGGSAYGQSAHGLNGGFGAQVQPLVDNSPYDSGCKRIGVSLSIVSFLSIIMLF